MEMHQIRYFLAVARTLNFTRAAEESNVTQPSLTRAIQKLEDEFGGLLFRRERSLTHLTDMGRQMLPHLDRTYQAAMAAKSLARGIGKAAVAPLNLGLATSVETDGVGAAIADVGTHLPGFQLTLHSGGAAALFEELLKGDLDIVIAPAPRHRHERLDTLPLFVVSYAVVAPDDHALCNCEAVALAALHGVAWIGTEGDIDEELDALCATAGVEPDRRHAAAGTADTLRLVAARLGCALVGDGVALPAGIRRVAVDGLALSREVVLATVSGRQRPPAGDALLRAVKARAWP